MRSFKPPVHSYYSRDLANLEWALDSVWATIKSNDPFRDLDEDKKLKVALRRKLFDLARQGVEDAEALRNHLLAGIPLP